MKRMRAAVALMVVVGIAGAACAPAADVPVSAVTRSCPGMGNTSPTMPDGLVAYNADGGYAMVVSQRTGVDRPADIGTWKWSCSWSRLTGPDDAPVGYAMAYDPALHMTILAGQSKTYGWDGDGWVDLHASSPLNLGTTSFAYDASRTVMVLVDSFQSGLNTWTYDGHGWKKVGTAAAIHGGSMPALAYGAKTSQLLLFGAGITWIWDGSSWSLLHPAVSPPADATSGMAYDDATAQLLLVNRDGETWCWDGGTWTKLGDGGPQYSRPGGLVYDAAGRQLFMWMTDRFWDRSQTWIYTGGWLQLP